jgi:hypothetical protein
LDLFAHAGGLGHIHRISYPLCKVTARTQSIPRLLCRQGVSVCTKGVSASEGVVSPSEDRGPLALPGLRPVPARVRLCMQGFTNAYRGTPVHDPTTGNHAHKGSPPPSRMTVPSSYTCSDQRRMTKSSRTEVPTHYIRFTHNSTCGALPLNAQGTRENSRANPGPIPDTNRVNSTHDSTHSGPKPFAACWLAKASGSWRRYA